MPLGQAGAQGFAQLAQALSNLPQRRSPRARRRPVAESKDASLDWLEDLHAAELDARAGRLHDAQMRCQRLWPILLEQGDALQRGICQHVLAISLQYSGRMREAVQAGQLAIEHFGRAADTARRLRAQGLQAIALARLRAGREALALIAQGSAALAGQDLREQSIFWNNAGAALHELGRCEAALDAARKAELLIADQSVEPELREVCRGNRLTYELQLGCEAGRVGAPHPQLRERLVAMQAFIGEIDAAGRHHLMVQAAECAVEALLQFEELDAARTLLRRCVALAERAGAGTECGVLELRLAGIERLAGRPRTAAAHLTLALDMLSKCPGQAERLAQAHLENSRLHEAQGHWRAALDSHKRYAELALDLAAQRVMD